MSSTESYLRNRRLAYGVAAAAVLLLAVYLLAGRLPDTYGRPSLVIDAGGWTLLHDSLRGDQQDLVQVALTLDPKTSKPASRTALFGGATALGPGNLIFYGRRCAPLNGTGSRELPMRWPVSAAAGDAGTLWIAGVDAPPEPGARRAIRACTLTETLTGIEETVAEPESEVETLLLTASSAGPTAAWKEKDSKIVRIVRRIEGRWQALDSVDLGPAVKWTTAQVGSRQLVISFAREDRAWRSATFRVECCKACRQPPPPNRWTFTDPLVLGRYLTGIAAVPVDGSLILCTTRTSSIQLTSVPLDALQPAPEARLISIPISFPWSQAIILLWLMAMLFLAITLVYLGTVLMRERRRFILSALGVPLPPGPRTAGIFSRLMALLIDFVLLIPFEFALFELFDLLPAGPDVSLEGPELRLVGLFLGIQCTYFFFCEWLTGRTLGKRLVGIRVARLDGSRITLVQAFLRNLLRVADYAFFASVAVVSMLLTSRRQRIGDLVARTVVLEDEPAAAKESPEAVSLRKVLERAVERAKERERK